MQKTVFREARRLAELSPQMTALKNDIENQLMALYMKENLNRAVSGEVDDCLDLEVTHHVHCGQTEDHKNATKAFVEKKQPVFKGR